MATNVKDTIARMKASGKTDAQSKDTLKGAEFAADAMGPDGLKRLGDDAEVQSTLQRFKDISETGMSSAESEAEKAQAFKSIEGNTQTSLRSMQARLAKMGVKGATAGMQLMKRDIAGAQQKGDFSRKLFLESERMKREGLKDYSSRLGEVKSFDLGQEAKESDLIVQSGLSFAQIGSSERSAAYAAQQAKAAQVASARASRPKSCFIGNQKVQMIDGSYMELQDLKPGMYLENDDLILGVSQHLAEDDLFSYRGVKVTGHHFVWENDTFIPVKDSALSSPIAYNLNDIYVYNLITQFGTITIDGVCFSDWEDDKIKEAYEKVQEVRQGKVQSRNSGDR